MMGVNVHGPACVGCGDPLELTEGRCTVCGGYEYWGVEHSGKHGKEHGFYPMESNPERCVRCGMERGAYLHPGGEGGSTLPLPEWWVRPAQAPAATVKNALQWTETLKDAAIDVADMPPGPAPDVIRVGGRPRGPAMPCGWGCGGEYVASEIQKHFSRCPKRPGGKA